MQAVRAWRAWREWVPRLRPALSSNCTSASEPPAAGVPSPQVYLSLRRLVDAHALSCISVRCFDLVSAKATTGGCGERGCCWGAQFSGQTLAAGMHDGRREGPPRSLLPPPMAGGPATLYRAGCYSLARLFDEGVIAGCEGDVCSALGLLWSRLMTGRTPWMANVAQVGWAGVECMAGGKTVVSAKLQCSAGIGLR